MTYTASIIDPRSSELDLNEFFKSAHWERINFRDIKSRNRILVIRDIHGARTITEGVTSYFRYPSGTWINSQGTAIASYADTNIFRLKSDR